MANPSLSEYVAQSQRGLYQSIFGPGFLNKAEFTVGSGTTSTPAATNQIFTTTYGRKVWQALNNQTRFFNAIPRTVWGNTAGWRVRTDRGTNRSRPVLEAGALPDVDVSNIEPVASLPRIVATTFGASVKSVFTAQLEGGVGDVSALENENSQIDHMKEVNQEILSGSFAGSAATAANDTTFVVPNAAARYFHVGDTVMVRDNQSSPALSNAVVISDSSTGVANTTFTVGALGLTPIAEDTIYARGRGGFTSIDDIVMEHGAPVHGHGWPTASATTGVGVYDITGAARTAGGWNAAASASYNGGTGRDLSLNLIDTCIQKVRENGGEPKLIVLGHDQYFKLERLLNSQQRYMGQEEYQVGIGSERTFPGTRTGLVLATYMGIPILPDADVPSSTGTSGTPLGSNIYVLDTDYLEMAIAQPTQYIENRDYFAADKLVVRGLLYTMGEFRCKNFFVQAKIGDLNA